MHTCETYDLEWHLSGKSAAAVALYHLLVDAAGNLGEMEIVPMKSSILFRLTTAFASVTVRRKWLDINFAVEGERSSSRIRRTERISARRFAHSVRIEDPDDIDDELVEWLAEARALSAE
jgi:hypothetical protein